MPLQVVRWACTRLSGSDDCEVSLLWSWLLPQHSAMPAAAGWHRSYASRPQAAAFKWVKRCIVSGKE
jgi:hypothetical protein